MVCVNEETAARISNFNAYRYSNECTRCRHLSPSARTERRHRALDGNGDVEDDKGRNDRRTEQTRDAVGLQRLSGFT